MQQSEIITCVFIAKCSDDQMVEECKMLVNLRENNRYTTSNI